MTGRRNLREANTATTAPQRLDALADGARNRLTAVEDIVDAVKALYALLTPEQRNVADRRLALPLAALTTSELSRASR
ncbi:MAG: Spy/CpxP family protein refolding chaperone [Casimicrobiaceae bacterium]